MGKKSKKKKGLHVDSLSERERVEIFGRAAKLRKASINKNFSHMYFILYLKKGIKCALPLNETR